MGAAMTAQPGRLPAKRMAAATPSYLEDGVMPS